MYLENWNLKWRISRWILSSPLPTWGSVLVGSPVWMFFQPILILTIPFKNYFNFTPNHVFPPPQSRSMYRLFCQINTFEHSMLSKWNTSASLTTYHMRGKITERWFADKEGIFSLITRALLVIEGMITWCWLAGHACIKLVSRLKRNSETHRFWVWSKHGCFDLTWKKMNVSQSAVFWWKSKRIFPVFEW